MRQVITPKSLFGCAVPALQRYDDDLTTYLGHSVVATAFLTRLRLSAITANGLASMTAWHFRHWAFWGTLASAIALAQLRGELPTRRMRA